MMPSPLQGIRVAMLATDGVEQIEFTEPKKALETAGARIDVISLKETFQGFNHDKPGDTFSADVILSDANPETYDALVLPGGVMNPDTLRMVPAAVEFTRAMFAGGKPIASICHGPWLLIEADVVRGKSVTSWPSLKTDLTNAGATWTDSEAIVDGNLLTSRKPNDLPAFCKAMIALFQASSVTDKTAVSQTPFESEIRFSASH